MQISVTKRAFVLVVVALLLGLSTKAAVGSGVHHDPAFAATQSVPPKPATAHHAARTSAPVLSRSALRAAVATSTASTPAPKLRVASGAAIWISAVTQPNTAQAAADACRGPIEILWPGLPTEIAEHDYCGGAWFNSVTTGERIRVIGGTIPGEYVVNGRRLLVSHGTAASALSGLGDLVLQTCVGSRMVLVGLSRG